MKLSIKDLELLCELGKDAAVKAGRYISGYKKDNLEVLKKSVGSSRASQVVTEVDFKSQELILDILKPTLKKYDLGLLTEESTDDNSRFVKDYFWCIDPLDGTLPFIQSGSGFSVSIALVSKQGEPIIGIIYDPVSRNLYHGIKGLGLFKNSEKIEAAFHDKKGLFRCIVDKSMEKHPLYNKLKNNLETQVITNGYIGLEILNFGGAVINAIEILNNMADCYIKLPKNDDGGGSLWDFSATALLFNEAEMFANDIEGIPLKLNNESTFMNKTGILYCRNIQDKNYILHSLKM